MDCWPFRPRNLFLSGPCRPRNLFLNGLPALPAPELISARSLPARNVFLNGSLARPAPKLISERPLPAPKLIFRSAEPQERMWVHDACVNSDKNNADCWPFRPGNLFLSCPCRPQNLFLSGLLALPAPELTSERPLPAPKPISG